MRDTLLFMAAIFPAAGCERTPGGYAVPKDAPQPDARPIDAGVDAPVPADLGPSPYVQPWECKDDPDGPDMVFPPCGSTECNESEPWCCTGGVNACEAGPEPYCTIAAESCGGTSSDYGPLGSCNALSPDGGPLDGIRYYCCTHIEKGMPFYTRCACDCPPDDVIYCGFYGDDSCPPDRPFCVKVGGLEGGGECRASEGGM